MSFQTNYIVTRFAVDLVASLVAGIVATALSGMAMTPFTRMGVDVVQKSAPFPWVIRVIPRGDHILWDMFVADLAVWVSVALVISVVAIYLTTRKR